MKQKMPYSELQFTSRVGHNEMMASDSVNFTYSLTNHYRCLLNKGQEHSRQDGNLSFRLKLFSSFSH